MELHPEAFSEEERAKAVIPNQFRHEIAKVEMPTKLLRSYTGTPVRFYMSEVQDLG